MQDLVLHLSKRRTIMMGVVVFLALLAIVVSYNFKITPTSYFGGSYNNYFLSGLFVYKLIELPILYYLLLYRHVVYVRKYDNYLERLPKIKKHTKLLLFLIPQGNTIFGIIAYKLSANVLFFLLFSSIAIITLFLVKPDKLL